MKKYAISDIHGCLKTFKALLKKINFSKKDELFILGDMVDRGHDSKGTIDFIWELQDDNYSVTCIKGNHEQMMIDTLKKKEATEYWLKFGGVKTLHSFGVSSSFDVPKRYIDFMQNLPFFLEIDEYILVHGGLNFSHPNPLEDHNSMIWTRLTEADINYNWLNGRIVVFGHTIYEKTKIRQNLSSLDKIPIQPIDNGCVYFMEDGYSLCAFEMTERKLFFQTNIDD